MLMYSHAQHIRLLFAFKSIIYFCSLLKKYYFEIYCLVAMYTRAPIILYFESGDKHNIIITYFAAMCITTYI